MIKKFLVCLVAVSIFGYAFVHGFSHVQANASVNEFHSEVFSHHDHDSLALDHHEQPFENDHLHLEEFFKRSSSHKILNDEFVLTLVSCLDSYLKNSDRNSSFQLVNIVSGYYYRTHLAYTNLLLRI